MTCPRRAWLTLGSLSVDLESEAGGWFCPSLDLGYPTVRDVTDNRPARSGIDDRTAFFGGRAITAEITALTGARASIDGVAASFAPFMDPAARPTLHYVLDRPGNPERVVPNLRAAGYSWPIQGAWERDIQLQWVAPDPAILDPTVQTAIARSGSSSAAGRTYPLTFNRIYPPGGGSPSWGTIYSAGDLGVRPLYRLYGPITGPIITISISVPTFHQYAIRFLPSFVLGAGQWVDIDSGARTLYFNSDPTQSAATALDWQSTQWAVISPKQSWGIGLLGSSTTGVTQVQAIWQDAYLT